MKMLDKLFFSVIPTGMTITLSYNRLIYHIGANEKYLALIATIGVTYLNKLSLMVP
jgi:hypothetical protein